MGHSCFEELMEGTTTPSFEIQLSITCGVNEKIKLHMGMNVTLLWGANEGT